MVLTKALERLPGAIRLMPLQLEKLPLDECRRLLLEEGGSLEGFFDDAIRPALERALGRRYCALFGPAIALGLLSWGVAAVALTSDGQALIALAAVPAPCILAVGGMRYQAQKVAPK
mmetsp:Transcript_127712/g.408881  ORF Transcript_127712/g.408881 Transcript_127712/m.408881 type:complete len:117 (-) Transcript_127712:128-478(-)